MVLVSGCVALGCSRARDPAAALAPEISEPAEDIRLAFASEQLDTLLLVEGARVFDERCSPCHGARGTGDGVLAEHLPARPRNYHAEPFKWGNRPSDIVRTITVGRSHAMPAFEGALTPRQMWAVAYLVWNLIPAEDRSPDP